MRVILFLNGSKGCQTGIEDGFLNLKEIGCITELSWVYFEEVHKELKFDINDTLKYLLECAFQFQPDLISIFHIGRLKINKNFVFNLRRLNSSPLIVYDEGDMYGTWAKPISKNIKTVMHMADAVSIRGLGKFEKKVSRINKRTFYTPHHNDIARFLPEIIPTFKERKDFILIGNRVKPSILGVLRRLPGAKGRESFVKYMGEHFSKDFKLYGNGWEGFTGNQGPVDFYKQNDFYSKALVTVAYEHYPQIPYYFSNRLPMALMNGCLYVCHEHDGYKQFFPNDDFIFFFRSNEEVNDILRTISNFSEDEFEKRSRSAVKFSRQHFHPNVVWKNFFDQVISIT